VPPCFKVCFHWSSNLVCIAIRKELGTRTSQGTLQHIFESGWVIGTKVFGSNDTI